MASHSRGYPGADTLAPAGARGADSGRARSLCIPVSAHAEVLAAHHRARSGHRTLNAINPIGIVIGLILFIPIANKFNVFKMLVYGAMVSAFSLFPLACPGNGTVLILPGRTI